jgi:hypothetical protein
MKKLRTFTIIGLIFASWILSACSTRVGWFGWHKFNETSANFVEFDAEEQHCVLMSSGKTLKLDYSAEVGSGSLLLSVTDPQDNVVWKQTVLDEPVSGEVKIPADDGQYRINVVGDKAKNGNYQIQWEIQ